MRRNLRNEKKREYYRFKTTQGHWTVFPHLSFQGPMLPRGTTFNVEFKKKRKYENASAYAHYFHVLALMLICENFQHHALVECEQPHGGGYYARP